MLTINQTVWNHYFLKFPMSLSLHKRREQILHKYFRWRLSFRDLNKEGWGERRWRNVVGVIVNIQLRWVRIWRLSRQCCLTTRILRILSTKMSRMVDVLCSIAAYVWGWVEYNRLCTIQERNLSKGGTDWYYIQGSQNNNEFWSGVTK